MLRISAVHNPQGVGMRDGFAALADQAEQAMKQSLLSGHRLTFQSWQSTVSR